MGVPQIIEKPIVFEYTDFRLYLSDMYNYLKSTKPQFSYRYFSQKSGFSSPNFLKLVINGDRNLSEESILKFTNGLALDSVESEYFKILVHFNQSSLPLERAQFAEEMFIFLNRRKIVTINSSEMNYYARWFNIVIREMVGLKNFKEEENWIANQFNPPLTESEVRESLINLEKLGLIVRNSKGRLELNNLSLNTNNEVYSSLVALYHKKMLELASNSIDKVPREERELSALCLPVSEVTAKKIKKKIQEFREELLMIVAEDKNAERVYQVNMQLFPLTKKVKETA